jgi:regulatory protein
MTARSSAAKKRPANTPPAKTPTARRLRNIALHYLKRYPSSAANLKTVLRRRVVKLTLTEPALRPEAFAQIDTLVTELIGQGAVNDLAFARGTAYAAAALRKPARKVRLKLAAKGVAKDVIAQVIEETTSVESEFEAALAIARRRRLGPFRKTPRDRDTDRKDLGALVRAGVDFTVAKKVMAHEDKRDDDGSGSDGP